LKFNLIILTLFIPIYSGWDFKHCNKWNYIGLPEKFASENVTMYMGDSPAANFEMGPFARGSFVMFNEMGGRSCLYC